MAIINPVLFKNYRDILRWAQSVYDTFQNGITIAQPVSTDNLGNYTTFAPGNLAGVMYTIGPYNVTGYMYNWSSSGVVTINHGLLKLPIGYIVCNKNSNSNIWQNTLPTADQITFSTTDNSSLVSIFIF